MDSEKRAYLELHVAVLLFGFTAILGDLIQLSALVLVWWRVLLTSISLLFLIKVVPLIRQMPRRLLLRFMGIGVLVALHWLAFYGSIKLANASIALVCMATTSFFTSLLEPWIMRQKVKGYEIALGLLILPGMILIVNATELSMMSGIWVGLLSAFLAALFGTLNKKYIGESNVLNITFLELGTAWLFLSLILPFALYNTAGALQFMPSLVDWGYLLVLALFCTTLAYVLALRSLVHLTAFAANLTINLEPVYGIALALILLDDSQELTANFYFGVLIIMGVVFTYPWFRKRFSKKNVPI
ncbi:MAG: membrane protein [Saprospiraceae bacterium]|nr:MAG: membrane protein [Saprospiraceae bacterium]